MFCNIHTFLIYKLFFLDKYLRFFSLKDVRLDGFQRKAGNTMRHLVLYINYSKYSY